MCVVSGYGAYVYMSMFMCECAKAFVGGACVNGTCWYGMGVGYSTCVYVFVMCVRVMMPVCACVTCGTCVRACHLWCLCVSCVVPVCVTCGACVSRVVPVCSV